MATVQLLAGNSEALHDEKIMVKDYHCHANIILC